MAPKKDKLKWVKSWIRFYGKNIYTWILHFIGVVADYLGRALIDRVIFKALLTKKWFVSNRQNTNISFQ